MSDPAEAEARKFIESILSVPKIGSCKTIEKDKLLRKIIRKSLKDNTEALAKILRAKDSALAKCHKVLFQSGEEMAKSMQKTADLQTQLKQTREELERAKRLVLIRGEGWNSIHDQLLDEMNKTEALTSQLNKYEKALKEISSMMHLVEFAHPVQAEDLYEVLKAELALRQNIALEALK